MSSHDASALGRTPLSNTTLRWLFRGPCGLTPWRRCQPGSGATRSEPVFPTKREGQARRRRRHAMVVEALVPPGAGSSRRDSYRDSRRNSRRNSVHKCPKTAPRGHFSRFVYTIAIPRPLTTYAHGATVYTNAPKRCREAISTDLCTLLCPHGRSNDPCVATVYTNAPKRRREAILANLCTLLRHRPGGEGHAALAVTQPPTHTSSRSLVKVLRFAGRLGAMAATLPFGVTCLFDGP